MVNIWAFFASDGRTDNPVGRNRLCTCDAGGRRFEEKCLPVTWPATVEVRNTIRFKKKKSVMCAVDDDYDVPIARFPWGKV